MKPFTVSGVLSVFYTVHKFKTGTRKIQGPCNHPVRRRLPPKVRSPENLVRGLDGINGQVEELETQSRKGVQ